MNETEPAIELHCCMTPNVLKVMFMLGELEMPFRLRHVRIYRGENFADGFERLNPHRKLPVLVDREGPGGRPHRVFESGAILLYLAEKTGRPRRRPRSRGGPGGLHHRYAWSQAA